MGMMQSFCNVEFVNLTTKQEMSKLNITEASTITTTLIFI